MRVVCGVDDTPDNGYVLERAMALCKDLGAELVVVTVRQSARPSAKGPALPFDPGTYRSGALEDAATTLQQHAAAALAAGARGRVEIGDPAARLAEVAMDEGASLVVIGWRRRGGCAAAEASPPDCCVDAAALWSSSVQALSAATSRDVTCPTTDAPESDRRSSRR